MTRDQAPELWLTPGDCDRRLVAVVEGREDDEVVVAEEVEDEEELEDVTSLEVVGEVGVQESNQCPLDQSLIVKPCLD